MYNPLDKQNLGRSVADALLAQAVGPLPGADASASPLFRGAGVYALYYTGCYAAYQTIAAQNRGGRFERPIYVGRAVPKGARKGGFGLGAHPGTVLFDRLREHRRSIELADNLEIQDFACRWLVVDDIWIPLGESLLIQMFQPIWNRVIDGFGIHDPGKGRTKQQKSRWDSLHPGRPFASVLPADSRSVNDILAELDRFFDRAPVETVDEVTESEMDV